MVIVPALAALAGCGTGGGRARGARVGVPLRVRHRRQDGAAACHELSSKATSSLESSNPDEPYGCELEG